MEAGNGAVPPVPSSITTRARCAMIFEVLDESHFPIS
jgi:hypothetical protein